MTYKYDLFISHASEDKDFVRPFAEALRAQRLAVWFDEFALKPGMGLRESIDQGLLSSRFGLVVLSPAFFAKSWPRWELDGLVQLAHSRLEPTLLPMWHKVGHSDITAFSPSLANIVAIPSFEDPDRATAEVSLLYVTSVLAKLKRSHSLYPKLSISVTSGGGSVGVGPQGWSFGLPKDVDDLPSIT